MPVGEVEYRDALSRFASGVTIVTVAAGGHLHGMTASSFAAVSLDPPLVLVSLELSSRTRELILEVGEFAVNVLASEQESVARTFATAEARDFERLAHRRGRLGAPLLDGALAWIECRVHDVVKGGDHDVILGLVEAAAATEGEPLIYFRRSYRSLT